MRVYYAGFYNLKPEYLEPIKNIEELHVLRSYYYYKDLMDFLKKVRKYKEEGVVNGSQQGTLVTESSEGTCGIGEGRVSEQRLLL